MMHSTAVSDAVEGLLHWLTSNVKFFAVRESDDAGRTQKAESQRKAFAELALTCMVARRHRLVRRDPQFTKLLDHVVATANDVASRLDLRRADLFPYYLGVYATAKGCGADLSDQRHRLQRMLDSQFVDRIERAPWEQIDLLYYLGIGGFTHDMPGMETWYRASIAHRLPAIPYLRAFDSYTLTHILFYMADFGRRRLNLVLSDRFEATREYVHVLLGTYAYRRHWDLVGELIICCACLDRFRPALLGTAWRGLLLSQLTSGCVPGIRYNPRSSALSDPAKASTYVFEANYHPTLVALMAAAIHPKLVRAR